LRLLFELLGSQVSIQANPKVPDDERPVGSALTASQQLQDSDSWTCR